MADESYHVVILEDVATNRKTVEMATLADLEARGWRRGERHMTIDNARIQDTETSLGFDEPCDYSGREWFGCLGEHRVASATRKFKVLD